MFQISRRRRISHHVRPRLESLEARRLLAAQSVDVGDPIELTQLWTDVADLKHQFADSSHLCAGNVRRFALNRDLLKSRLDDAPLEFTTMLRGGTTISIPTPSGELHEFRMFQSPLMSPELAAKFPEIETYSGRGITDPAATIRIDLSPAGFHAQVLSPGGGYLIDPYYHLNDSLYASYRRDANAIRPEFQFLSHDEHDSSALSDGKDFPLGNTDPVSKTALRSGTQLRTYRAAVAATGEYTTFHGGSVPLGQAAIVTAINRVTGIYETELSIRLQLVANNDQLVFTSAGSDPYTNNNGVAMLAQNQTTIDSLIQPANYDIGHVFSTGGGGVAELGSVGINAVKAEGVTGLDPPVGDKFFVDFVAHEMGHQFGAEHTWNGNSGSCDASQHAPNVAMEPGSGSTIMGYAGICDNDDLQANSDPYFHSVSFDQIIAHVDNAIPLVGTRTATLNSVPTADAGNDFTIPAQTPFLLTGSGSDSDFFDQLTYGWEQRDAGPRQDIESGDTGNNPLFRSFLATSEPTRTFPQLGSLLNNTAVKGETLPTTTRTMDFRLTARDGNGGVNTDDMVVNVVNTGNPFAVTSPNGGMALPGVAVTNVAWDVAGTTANGINASSVNILLSTDGGATFPIPLASGVANNGSRNVVLPGVNTSLARIKVEAVGNIFFDISDTNFTIGTPPSLVCSSFEHFDSVSAPNLPPGWVTAISGAGIDWVTTASLSDTSPNHAFVPNPANTSGSTLTSPVVSGPQRILFQHDYDTEADFDGGVLEISIGGGPFVDIVTAGGRFVVGGYNSTLPNFDNPLAGRNAWSGDSGGYVSTAVNLPATSFGRSVQFRWRFGTDELFGGTGWRVDSIQTCNFPTPLLDFGNAPAPYPVLFGPSHEIGGPLFLGTSIDPETEGQRSSDAMGDDTDGNDDEDGVTLPATIFAGTNANIVVEASTNLGLLNAWVDFNDNGSWLDSGEQIFFNQSLNAGVNGLSFPVPADATVTPETFARFRLSTQPNQSFVGSAIDGEVEDYALAIDSAQPPTVLGVQLNEGKTTRSQLTDVEVTFDQEVNAPGSAFDVFQRGTGTSVQTLIVNTSLNASNQTVAEITFHAPTLPDPPDPLVQPRGLGSTLIDGNFQLDIDGSQITPVGGGPPMASNVSFGDDEADEFYRFLGDNDKDRDTDVTDLGQFGLTFRSNSADGNYNPDFDFNGDLDVDVTDLGQFGIRFRDRLDFQ